MKRRRVFVLGAVVAAGLGMAGTASAVSGSQLVSVHPEGGLFTADTASAEVSDDGTRVVFDVREGDRDSIYLRDRTTGSTKEVYGCTSSPGEFDCAVGDPSLSGNGQVLALQVYDDRLNERHIHVVDLMAPTTEPARIAFGGGAFTEEISPSLSDTGGRLAFAAHNGSTWSVYVANLSTGVVTRLTNPVANATDPVISGDGALVAYRQYRHTYLRNLSTGAVTRVDVKSSGAFTAATNSTPIAVSDSGGYVAFTSAATDLVSGTGVCDDGDGDAGCLFRRNVVQAKTTLASVLPTGNATRIVNGDLSGDAKVVTFDTTTIEQIYARTLSLFSTRTVSRNAAGESANATATDPSISQTGGLVTFHSRATNLGHPDVPADQVWIANGR